MRVANAAGDASANKSKNQSHKLAAHRLLLCPASYDGIISSTANQIINNNNINLVISCVDIQTG